MTEQGQGGAPSRKTWWIAALLAVLIVALVVWLMSRGGRDDNLVPEATAIDPNTGELTATGTAALDATGTDSGGPGAPGVYNEDSTGGAAARTGSTAAGVGATGAVTSTGAPTPGAPAAGTATPPAAGGTAPGGTPPQ